MTRRALTIAVLAYSMFASVPVVGQGKWTKLDLLPGIAPRPWLVAGVQYDPFAGFNFEPLASGVAARLSPALDQKAVVVFLTGPQRFAASKTDVWVLQRDATVAPLRTRLSEVVKQEHGSDYAVHRFVFDGAVNEVVGITVSIDGQLYVRSVTPKPPE